MTRIIHILIITLNVITKINSGAVILPEITQNLTGFLNFGSKKPHNVNSESEVQRPKIDVLGEILRKYIDSIKSNPKLDIVFLIDSSSSIGENNFKSELKFVKKLLSDVVVDYNHTRIAVVPFSSSNNILKNIDEIGKTSTYYNKCALLTKKLKNIKYKGGETFTLGALNAAKDIFESSNRNDSKKVIFLITDGYSNGGDPVPVARELKKNSVTIFTIGIQNGNYKELYEISSDPGEYYSYLLDSFSEFESLARRALHSDIKNGDYYPLEHSELCNVLCPEGDCCDSKATCSCGTTTGHYACLCKAGYYGSGLKNNCFPCASGTYSDGPNICLPCPDPLQITTQPAIGLQSCKCKEGYKASANNKECKELKCHKISAPENGYYVKNKVCPNVIFSACGIRCEVGYALKGTSVRLCQKNATWSGLEPECEIKTCRKLEVPTGGKMECSQPETKEKMDNITEILPVDTICKFSCNEGFILSGSRERICLPISRWSGLNTICKPKKCKKLMPINFGTITPASCTYGTQEYGKVCQFSCNEGFKLQGPSKTRCVEINGGWDNKFEKTTCADITLPKISCPENLVGNTLPGRKFGLLNWSDPIVTDNSNMNLSVWIKPAVPNKFSYKFGIGTTRLVYFVQDAFQNTANCSFEVTIEDKDAPVFENCVNPPTFLTNDPKGANISWDEPYAYDNSQNVSVRKSHEFGFFKIGTTLVTYIASDSSNNTDSCSINVTVEVSRCEQLPNPPNGESSCLNQTEGIHCVITCNDGYSVPIAQIAEKENGPLFICNNAYPVWYSEDGFSIPECSITQIPEEFQDGKLVLSNTEDCANLHNVETIKNDSTYFLQTEFCTENCTIDMNIDCNMENQEVLKMESYSPIVKREIGVNTPQKSQKLKRRSRVNVKYQLKRKYNSKNRPLENSQIQLRSGLKGSLYYKARISCPQGSIQRKKRCVHCPKGTFHNATRNSCQNCPFGQYNDKVGQTSCSQCPIYYSTGKVRSKKLLDCKEQCPPGTHARKKIQKIYRRNHNTTIEKTTLKPHCNSCGIGYYQPYYGELHCLPCPEGYTTTAVGSVSIEQCIPTSEEICKINNLCINGKCIFVNNYEYTCNCFENYIGNYCEDHITMCQSQPCYNEGQCQSIENGFTCVCKEGYTGMFCQDTIETKRCLNNGIYYIEDNGNSTCICPPEYSGDVCETKHNICDEIPCENNSTCIEEEGSFYCKCSGGYIGTRCHLLPCDYRPCGAFEICLNTLEDNTSRSSFKCVCPEGYSGENCQVQINHCSTSPCLNGGTCYNGLTNYTCWCPSLYSGINCEIKRNTNYVLNFNTYVTTDFVKLKPFTDNLSQISTCLWIQTLDDINYGTIISYATRIYDNAFTLTDYTGLVIYVNNQYAVTDIHLNDGLWHHLCVTWNSLSGTYQVYVDAKFSSSGSNLSSGDQIEGMGSIVLGQDQDIFGGGFSQSESFVGKLTEVDIWSRVLTEAEVEIHFSDCQKSFFGNLYAWPEMQEFVQGGIQVTNSDFCKNCTSPPVLFNGAINVDKDSNMAYYSCNHGYFLSNPDFMDGRKCTRASYWEGYFEPYCKKTYCGYPGSIRNGFIVGKKYFFQDKVSYNCNEGYNITGNIIRTCNESGQWFPDQPRCVGVQCILFAKPEFSELIIMASYEDSIENQTQFDVGTQIEITCRANYEITGDKLLTCLENGTWDYIPPTCKPKIMKEEKLACPVDQIPKPPANGFIDMDSFYQVSNGTKNVVEYKCKDGFILVGQNSTSCIIDGYWSEPKIICESVTCGKLPKFKNAIPTNEEPNNIYNIGTKISYQCEDGYEKLVNNLFIRCLASRKWSRIQGKCFRKSCGKPDITDQTEIEGRSYLFNDTVKISCKSGSTYLLVCNKDGIWDGNKDESC